MKVNLKCLKFTPKDQLKEFVDEKVSKLEKFDDTIISAEVTLSVQDGSHIDNKSCDIRLVIPGNDLIVKRTATSFEAAILDGVETMQNLITKKRANSY